MDKSFIWIQFGRWTFRLVEDLQRLAGKIAGCESAAAVLLVDRHAQVLLLLNQLRRVGEKEG